MRSADEVSERPANSRISSGECALRVWLCQIARNLYLNYCKKQARLAPIPDPEALSASLPEVSRDGAPGKNGKSAAQSVHGMDGDSGGTEGGFTPEDYLIRKETALRAHHALHHLREPYREVFSVRTFGELSFEEIGELFGKSASWARVTYYRARMLMKLEGDAEALISQMKQSSTLLWSADQAASND